MSTRYMKRIAVEFLGFDIPDLQNLHAEDNDSWWFNIQILHKWHNKSSDNSRSVSIRVDWTFDRSIINTKSIKSIHNIAWNSKAQWRIE